MGFIDSLFGNASEVDLDSLRDELAPILAPNETIQFGYKILRDMFVFTDKRLMLVDKQGLTGKKVDYHSIPYKSISHFAVETAGHFDMDAELKIWLSGHGAPISKELKKGTDMVSLQRALASFMFR